MDIIKDRLVGDSTLQERMLLEVTGIVELLKFCMGTTYFLFRGVIYEQVYGTAMGNPVSVVIANLFMEWFEQTALRTAPADIRPACGDATWTMYGKSLKLAQNHSSPLI